MSRIRSIHPGFFKDDRLVPCSAFARLLFIGLGVEADDKGIFEWKPVTLKMNIFPGDNIDMAKLLGELSEAEAIKAFSAAGKNYGAIRNFRKFQRPKTPNNIHPMPDDIAEYVSFPRKGEKETSDEGEFPPKVEIAPQMEDGGGKREDEGDNPEAAQHGSPRDAAPRCEENSLEWKLRKAADWWHVAPKLSLVQPIQALIDQGCDLDLDVLPTVRAYAEQAGSRTSWKYFIGPITDAWKARIAAGSAAPTPLPAAKVVELQSRVYVRYGTDQGDAWIAHYRKSLDKPAPRDMRGGWYFDSEWPPGHAQHNPKSTTVCPSPGDSAGEGRRLTEETDDVAGGGSAEVVAGVSHTMKSSEPPQPITETQAGFLVSPPAQEAGASAPAPASDLPDVPDFLKRRKGRAA